MYGTWTYCIHTVFDMYSTVNTHLSAAICFLRIWWINEFGR